MKIDRDIAKAKWIKYKNGMEFKIRPVPNSLIFSDMISGDQNFSKKRFMYAIEDWKGLEDQDGKKLKCDNKNKEFIYDFYTSIVQFITKYLDNLDKNLDAQVKN